MTTAEYAHMIVKNLITEFPFVYASMQRVSHNEPTMLSDWHLEGSVWTHTMMVVAAMRESVRGCPNYKELLLAALLHDVGKVYTREIQKEKQKVTFYGHPGMSTFLAKDMLPKIDPTLDKEQQIAVLRLINYHQVLFNLTDDMSDKAFNKLANKFDDEKGCFLLNDIIKLRNADSAGRISTSYGRLSVDKTQELEDLLTYNYLNNEPETEVPEQPRAVIMVGLPGSGKSTYTKQHYDDYTLVSRDAQIELLAPDLTYNEAFKTVDQKLVDTMYNQVLSDAIHKKENIIIDKTNLTHKGRMRVINPLRDKGYSIQIVVLMPTMITVYQRNQKRTGKTIPESVIHNMMTTFEMPFANEGIVKYTFDS